MKQFRVTEIVTTEDGRVILNGPSGSIEIKRQSGQHSSAVFHGQVRHGAQQHSSTDHSEDVAHIPEAIGSVPGSCAF